MIEMKLTRMVNFILTGAACSCLMFSYLPSLYAEPAPVYDADALEQPDDGSNGMAMNDQQIPQDLPPPPNQSADSAFIPIQSEVQPSAPVPATGRAGMERRLQRLEQQISNLQSSDLAAQVESLQNQIQSLRAELEQVTKTLHEAQSQQKTMYADMDARINKGIGVEGDRKRSNAAGDQMMVADETSGSDDDVSADVAKPVTQAPNKISSKIVANNKKVASTANAATSASGNESQPDVAEEQKIYQNAYNMIKTKKYDEAVKILQNMLQKYPSGQFASNAHYWLGELYGLLGKNDKALNEFDQVVRDFSDSPRVSDAMLKVGLIFAAQSKWLDAKNIFKKVINQYPGTASARLANEQLKQIKQAGH